MMTGEEGAGIPELRLLVRNPAGDVRPVTVKGLDRNALRELKYENKIAWRKKLTRERSGGRLAYHHVKMMVQAEVNRLKKALEEECRDAEGLVLDERDGVGGLAHRPICALLDSTAPERLNASPVCFTRNRNGSTAPDKYGQGSSGGRPSAKVWDKPVVMVMNEISRSDKEILPFTFRHLGIGYLVGMRCRAGSAPTGGISKATAFRRTSEPVRRTRTCWPGGMCPWRRRSRCSWLRWTARSRPSGSPASRKRAIPSRANSRRPGPPAGRTPARGRSG
jgi:hypothetical protein